METEKKPLDLAALAAVDEAEMEILDGNGAKTGWRWTFSGPAHPITIKLDNEANTRAVERQKAITRAQVNGKKWGGDDETADDIRDRNIRYIVTRLLRWSDMTMEGQPFPCTPENARMILSDRRFFLVYDQANAFLLEDKSFTKRSPKT
jgi:hypothetical protein